MRIAIVTETFYPATDGVVTRLTATVRWLLKHGHEVLVIAPDRGITEYEGAQVRGIPSFRFFLYPALKLAFPQPAVGRALEKFEPDIVHVANPAMLGAAGIWYGRRWPLVASYHTNVPQYADYYRLPWLKPVLWGYLRLLHNRAALNLCTSNTVLEELTSKGFRNVRLWQRGVNTELFQPGNFSLEMRRRLTGGEPDKPLLLYVGRLAQEKGIEKIREVLTADDSLRLAIVGDGPHREALESYYAGTRTTFTGFLHGRELAQAYASSDLFVFPSTTETLGLVLLEAMASGLPCVAARSGPTLEQIENGVTGYLYEPADRTSFVDAVSEALADAERLRQTGERAALSAAAYGWDEPCRQLMDYYDSVIELRASQMSRRRQMKERDA